MCVIAGTKNLLPANSGDKKFWDPESKNVEFATAEWVEFSRHDWDSSSLNLHRRIPALGTTQESIRL